MKIALGAARGLAFLHNAETKVIYRDFKTSNILLDSVGTSRAFTAVFLPLLIHTICSLFSFLGGFALCLQNYNAKLSDFGLARDGPTGDKSHVSTRVMGTYGYAAPEYLSTGRMIWHD